VLRSNSLAQIAGADDTALPHETTAKAQIAAYQVTKLLRKRDVEFNSHSHPLVDEPAEDLGGIAHDTLKGRNSFPLGVSANCDYFST
jgi:hypothetical protein